MGDRTPGRARLSAGFQPAPRARLEGRMTVVLRAGEASLADWRAIWRGAPVAVDPSHHGGVTASAAAVERILARGEPVYGINTGFGKLAGVRIEAADLAQLQRNIVLSHAAGVGEPASVATTRLMMALKLGSLAQGASGVRPPTLQLIEATRTDCGPRRAGLRNQHRLRQTRGRAHRGGRSGAASAQHRPLARRRGRRTRLGRDDASHDGAEARQPRPGRLGRPAAYASADRGDSNGLWPEASRSTESTPASANSRACASRRPIWRSFSATSSSRTPQGSANPPRSRRRVS